MNQPATGVPPVLLTIAGFDPSAGAGIAADLKTFAAHNCYGVAAVTAVTIQSTRGVKGVQPVSAEVLRAQLEELIKDVPVAAVKIGMLGTRANVQVVAELLEKKKFPFVVLDPVLKATSGLELLDATGVKELSKRLLGLATVITPNIAEAAVLSGLEIKGEEGMKAAAQKLRELGARAVVITGGDLEKPVDVFYDGTTCTPFGGERVKSENTHGTGCAFSSAIAANLALGRQLDDAVMLAKAYVRKAIERGYPIGKGKGPLNHFYRQQNGQMAHSHSTHVPAEGPAHAMSHF
ncbi:MAG: bifunctional hydroxymethylpyrimidine kinase/phosphomethylpyrimidine kinase [Acidobacteria bacterium RIFCSPHIGHO2_01_FULL_67_28]|nr:MAG: bifunctional hydroxymethylpyrimidine kinase/phosphomethylpyrimidine kinase [Acidobacteria bacterium RIFCSPHIGHO2_01_FULL_67_28]